VTVGVVPAWLLSRQNQAPAKREAAERGYPQQSIHVRMRAASASVASGTRIVRLKDATSAADRAGEEEFR
jgi:hypothetical protein